MANTKTGSFLAKYIKSISGTAVAEKEYDRLANVLQGGGSFENIQTLKQSFSTFGMDLDRDMRSSFEANYLDNTSTVLDLTKKYKAEGGMGDYYQKRGREVRAAAGKPSAEDKYATYLKQQGGN